MASYVTVLAKEGLASINGVKMAKPHLKAEQLKTIKSSYLKCFATYTLPAPVISDAVDLASYIASNNHKKQN